MIEERNYSEGSDDNQKGLSKKILSLFSGFYGFLRLLACIFIFVIGGGILTMDIIYDKKFAAKLKNLSEQNDTKFDEESLNTTHHQISAHVSIPKITFIVYIIVGILIVGILYLVAFGLYDSNEDASKKIEIERMSQEIILMLVLLPFLEVAYKSRFQVWFQCLCFYPTLVFFIRDSYGWCFDIRIRSIFTSLICHEFFVSFICVCVTIFSR